MSKNPKIVALLTGRGGSSLKDKNVLPVSGKPLLHYPAQAALGSEYVSDYYVSSDDEKILKTAEEMGYKPIKRPEELASDTAQHIDAIKHGLKVIEEEDGIKPDIVVVMLANTVAVRTEWVDECVKYLLEDESVTCAAPVYEEANHHPFRAKKIDEDGNLEPFFDFANIEVSTNRQDLEPSYFFCHNFWVLRTDSINDPNGQKPWIFMGNKIKPYIIGCDYLDVHTSEDVKRSEEWVKKYG